MEVRHSAIIVGQITNAFRSPRRILSVTFRRIEIRAPSFLSFSRDIFSLRSSSPFFFCYLLSLEKSHRRDVPPRKLNSSNERRRAGVIEKTSCEIGKAFLSSTFFLETTGQFDHDRKNMLDCVITSFDCFFFRE